MASSSNATAVKGGSGTTGTPANNVGGERKTSFSTGSIGSTGGTGGTGLFNGLMNQKRNSTDAAAQARRQSFHDMKPETGIIGRLWHDFTTGGGKNK